LTNLRGYGKIKIGIFTIVLLLEGAFRVMMNGRKIIGVCTTKIQDSMRADICNRMHHIAEAAGYKLIFFNSFVDFYRNDEFDKGAAAVYDLVDYNIIDVLAVFGDSFCSRDVLDGIISGAHDHGVPVVMINGTADGCFSVTGDYSKAYKSLISHVIKEHGITDTFFIAGQKKGDAESAMRIRCYKEALEENGIQFEESRVDYGEYWEDPTKRILFRLAGEGRVPPKAIFCANDHMAFAACAELKRYGWRVPEDVIVTGFDGLDAADHHEPQLTTCRDDHEALAAAAVKAIGLALQDGAEPCALTYPYIPRFSESCGCKKLAQSDFREIASKLYRTNHEMEAHEDFEYGWIDRMLDISDVNALNFALSGCMLENSYVCLNNDFLASIVEQNRTATDRSYTDNLVVIPSKYTKDEGMCGTTGMSLSELIPNADKWTESSSCYILDSIYVGSKVYGYYAVCTDNLIYNKHKVRRVHKTINIAFSIFSNRFKQDNMRQRVERAALTNSVTGMPNLKGAKKWFDEFRSDKANLEIPISVSVYALPKYSYILENYGLEQIEEAVRVVAESLKMSNPNDCFIAHIAEDEFAVINYFRDPNSISDVINSATSVFFKLIEAYNTDSGREYFVEVNAGCAVLSSDWNDSLESYIKFANSEMYMNRLKSGQGAAVKDNAASPKAHYQAFDLLIKKNLFTYHFQPIVSAKTGEICGYEALMRTDASIGMNPFQVLEAAKQYNKLYDIERATLFNIMERFSTDKESFGDKMVFINTIPGYFLNATDLDMLSERYGAHMDRVVFELTEQNTVSDEELNSIKKLTGNDSGGQIAIDDYGTGHSNIVNLMRYAPQIIKIDRFLITDIHKDLNKQMFVRSTVEFARLNGIKVLAEGVETSNEMRTAIDLGVDYIQGYYTARPAPEPIRAIPEDIRREIVEANPLFGQSV